MPFVRVSRDRHGYEHFYLVDSTMRRGKPSRPRVLYWFRTPPGVQVGREPFDESARRALEARYPDVVFDWEKLRKAAVPPPEVEPWRERRRLERATKQARQTGEREEGDAAPPEASTVQARLDPNASEQLDPSAPEQLDPDVAEQERMPAIEALAQVGGPDLAPVGLDQQGGDEESNLLIVNAVELAPAEHSGGREPTQVGPAGNNPFAREPGERRRRRRRRRSHPSGPEAPSSRTPSDPVDLPNESPPGSPKKDE